MGATVRTKRSFALPGKKLAEDRLPDTESEKTVLG